MSRIVSHHGQIPTTTNPSEEITKAEIRNLSNAKDRIISVEGWQKLITYYGQVKFKVKNHEVIHSLPYNVKDKVVTKTVWTKENIDSFMDGIENLVYDLDLVWFNNGIYQGNTDRE